MANHLEPPPVNYRDLFKGVQLVEMHVLAGSWSEYNQMIKANPDYARAVLEWICTEDSVDYAIYEHAKRLARASLAARLDGGNNGRGRE